MSKDVDRESLDCEDSKVIEDDRDMYGGDSSINPREVIDVQYDGIVKLNTSQRHIRIGDRVVMGKKDGEVVTKEFYGRDFLHSRPIR